MKYKLEIFPDIDTNRGSSLIEYFETKEELFSASNSCANLLLFVQYDLGLMNDYSNSFVTSEFVGDEWIEIDEDDY